MGVNKVVFGAVSIMDISDSTVTEDTLVEGVIAYGADGERLVGKMKPGAEEPKTCTMTVRIGNDPRTEMPKYVSDDNGFVYYMNANGEVTEASGLVKEAGSFLITKGSWTFECLCDSMLYVVGSLSSLETVTYSKEITVCNERNAIFRTPTEPGDYTIEWLALVDTSGTYDSTWTAV